MYITSEVSKKVLLCATQEVLITSKASNKVLMRQHQVLISIQKNKTPMLLHRRMAPPARIELTTDP